MFSTEFFVTSLVVVLIPGTGVIYTVSTGLFVGWRASIAAAIGCTAGIVSHLIASVLGLSAVMHMSALAFQVLKYAGSIYLVYLAWAMWRETGAFKLMPPAQRHGFVQTAIRGILINILNPKLSMFFWAFLPLFVTDGSATPLEQMLLLSVVFMGMTLVIFVLYGVMASGVSAYFTKSRKLTIRLQRTFAIIFAALAARLAMSEQ
jgi:threonine/homoserine/homoserine lactone efflux protein